MIGSSEIVSNTLNPSFTQQFKIFFNFELKILLHIEIWDIDVRGKDFLGQITIELGQIVGENWENYKNNKYPLFDKQKKKTNQSIIILYEKAVKSRK